MANGAVEVNFRVGGIAEVDKAFRSVEASIVRIETASTRAASRRKGDEERASDAVSKAAAKAERDREKEVARAQKAIDAERTRAAKTAAKLALDEAKEVEKAEKEKIKATQAWARQREMIQTNSAKLAFKLADEEVKAAEQAAARSAQARERYARSMGGTIMGSVGKVAGNVGMAAGALLTLGGGFGIADAMTKQFAAERTAALLVNAVTANGKVPQGANVKNILNNASAVGNLTGLDKDTILQGTLSYARTAKGGDFDGAMKNMAFFAKMSKVTGADINDIARSAGTLQSQNPDLDAKQMQSMLLDVYAQGKAGSMSMTDVAKQMGVLASTRNSYQGSAADNQRKLLALGQLAAPEGTVDEAGTFIKDLTLEAGKKSDKLRAMGVKFNDRGQMQSPEQMIEAVFKATGGNQTKIEDIFGARGSALFRSLGADYNKAGGGDAGLAAVRGRMSSVTGASMTSEELDAQFKQSMSNSAERFQVATNKLTEMIQAKLTPWLERLADKLPELMPKIEQMIDAFGEFADWLSDNPIKGVGGIILAAVAKDVGGAAIGGFIKQLIANSFSGSSAGGAASAAAGGTAKTGMGGAVAAAAAIGATAYVVNQSNEDLKAGKNLADQVRSGKLSAADAQKMVDRAKADTGFGAGGAALLRQTGIAAAIDAGASVAGKDTGLSARGSTAQQNISIANSKELAQAIADAMATNNQANNPNRSQPINSTQRGGAQ